MKICLINNLYPPYARGGAERIAEITAQEAIKAEHEVIIISSRPRFRTKILATAADGIKKYLVPSLFYDLNKIPLPFRLFWHGWDMFDIFTARKIKNILEKEKVDLVITHNLKGLSYLTPWFMVKEFNFPTIQKAFGFSIKKTRIKHIHILHDIQLIHPSGLLIYGKEKKINSFLAKIYFSICKKLFGSPDLVVAPSAWLLKMHGDRGFFPGSKKMVLPNPTAVISNPPVPPDPHHPASSTRLNAPHPTLSRSWGAGEGNSNCITPFSRYPITGEGSGMRGSPRMREGGIFHFLYVGQLETHKGVFLLVKSFLELLKKYPTCELDIVGDGSKIEEIEKLIGQNSRIEILGRKKMQEIFDLMKNSSCVIVPSLCYENSPTVIYEAIEVGLPVIASNIGGIPELLTQNETLLFLPEEKYLLEKMEWAVNNETELKKEMVGVVAKTKRVGASEYLKIILD
jgi:glycosyltransferase involved in cell wall biosynthesis